MRNLVVYERTRKRAAKSGVELNIQEVNIALNAVAERERFWFVDILSTTFRDRQACYRLFHNHSSRALFRGWLDNGYEDLPF